MRDAPGPTLKNYITPAGLQRLKDGQRFPLNRERPAATEVVAWTAGNDDGSAGSGTASGYEVRWGSNATLRKFLSPPLPADLYDRRFGIDTDVRYFDSNRTQLPVGGSLPASATSFRITGLPAIEDYYVQVRARDDVGNLGLLAPTNCTTGAACRGRAGSS